MKSCRTITRGVHRFGSLHRICFLVVVIFLMIGGNAHAVSFSADLVITEGGKIKTSTFFLLDDLYRLDVVENGQELIILVNRTSGKTRIVIPDEKQYREIENDSFQSVSNNPIEAYNRIRRDYESRTAGSETIAGIACDKVILSDAGTDLMNAWVARPYDLPILIVNPATGDKFELKNIKEGRMDKSNFQVPAGYTEQEDPAKKRAREEAALPFLTTTATGTAPLARRIGPGGEMRVAVDPEESVRIKFENFTQDESIFSIKGFRAGQPIDLDSQRTSFSLQGKGRRDECLVGVQNQAEEISVLVEKGKIVAEVFNEKSAFSHEDKTETFFIVTGTRDWGQGTYVDPKRQVLLTITSDSQDSPESKIKVTFYRDQEKKDKVDETDVVLENGQSKTLDYPAETGIQYLAINVAKGGGVQVIIEQPAPGKKAAAKKTAAAKTGKKPAPAGVKPPAAAASAGAKPAAASGTIFNGEAPLMAGAKVIQEKTFGANSRVDMEIPATPEEVVNFYKQAMTAKGWQAGMAMVQGPMGVLQLMKGKSQITLKATGNGQKTNVNMALTGP